MSQTNEMIYWSASKIANGIVEGEISSVAITQAYLDRIEAVNPEINAVVQLCANQALELALHYDQLRAKGKIIGPLHGVPITLKDSIDTEGIITTCGTMGRKHHIPDVDAPVAARLKAAGAVLMGKTNTPELTLSGETNNLIYGRTKNPFDLDRSPGGSSGGAAAILASAGSALDLGSDTGGSIREPAHLSGITGMKPTSGRTPRTGHIPPYGGGLMDSLTQIGPMARYVEDLKRCLPIICGPDGEDPYCIPVELGNPDDIDPRRLRIAYFSDNGVISPCEDVLRVTETVADGLKDSGFQIARNLMPGMDELVNLSTQLREACNAGLILRLLKRYGTTQPGPDLDGYLTDAGLVSAARFDPELMENIDQARSRALQYMSRYDVILCPASHTIARPHLSSHNDTFDDWSYITVLNLLGWPGATVRAGTSESGGLPVGVQVIAAPWREDRVLSLLTEIEKLFGGYQRPAI